MARARKGGVGTNQYRTRGQPVVPRSRQDVAAVVAAIEEQVEIESTAAAFGGEVPQLEKARSGEQMLRKVAAGSGYDRRRIAERKTCPPDLLLFLAHDESQDVRTAVAKNPNCPPEACEIIAANAPAPDGAEAICHPNCPEQAIRDYANRYPGYVRTVLGAPNTPPDMLNDIAERSQSLTELELVASHRNTPPDVLREMAEPGNAYAKYFRGQQDRSPFVNEVARNPSTPPDVLARLAHGPVYAVARNPSTPPETLAWIVDHAPRGSHADREALKNPACPAERVEEAIRSGIGSYDHFHATQGKAAAANPTVSGQLLIDAACGYGGEPLLRALELKECPDRVFVASVRFHDKSVWRAATKHPDCPEGVLAEHAFRPDPITARYVANHPNTPDWVLFDMSTRGMDKARVVADAALKARGIRGVEL